MYSVFSKYYNSLTNNVEYPARAGYFDRIIKEHLSIPPSADAPILLDLACGTGSLSIELSRLGYDVIGVDVSPDMLSVAMQKSVEAECQILYLCQDMARLDLYGTIDVTVCALDSINHVTDKAKLKKAFEKVSLFTMPGGLFVFDVNTVYKHSDVLADNVFVYDTDEVYCVWQNRFDEKKNLTEIRLDFFEQEDGAYYRSCESFFERAYTHEELSEMVAAAGLELLVVYADDGFEPVAKNTQRAVYVTKKRVD